MKPGLLVPLAYGLGLFAATTALPSQSTIQFTACESCLQLAGPQLSGNILLAQNDWSGVIRAARNLAVDFGRVVGKNATVTVASSTAGLSDSSTTIIAGTIGDSSIIDGLISSGKLDVSGIIGQWESYNTAIVSEPVSGVSAALVIVGSDKRGTIYGLYDVSEQIGVSPWYWWADVSTTKQTSVYAINTNQTRGPPSVKYRGIFLNDEQPALTNWVSANYPRGKYGPGYNSDFYSRVFELLLRLKANYLWPTMWDSMFYVDDANSGVTANDYGIIMGTSHTEPLARATKEESQFLKGSWDWSNNKANVKSFMQAGIDRAKDWDTVWTLGMRGSGDAASPTLDSKTLEEIISWQQGALQSTFPNKHIADIPQMWCIYKEVGGYFQKGMDVPDNIILLWPDDNIGNLERVPIANETQRPGGAGVYFHMDYVGSPRNYKWINTIQLSKTWQQMKIAYERTATKMWIVNVGDLKPLEIPLHHFLDMAYDMSSFSTPGSTDIWLRRWASSQFGDIVANATASAMATYGKLIVRRKYELLSLTPTYSVANYDEAERVLNEWTALLNATQQIYDSLDASKQPAFFETVLHPSLAGKTVHEVYIKATINAWYAAQKRTSTNVIATEVRSAFAADASITQRYHSLLGGKWNHMMDQVHFGYTSWSDPSTNLMPSVSSISTSGASTSGIMGVAIQGSNAASSKNSQFTLDPINTYMAPSDTRHFDIFTRFNGTFAYKISSNATYVSVTSTSGSVSSSESDVRININVDWPNAPLGRTYAQLQISDDSSDNVYLNVPIDKTSVPVGFSGFVESNGVIAIEAEHYVSATTGNSASYATIPNYGRTLSGVTLMPVTCSSQSTTSGPALTYSFYSFTSAPKAKLSVDLGMTLNFDPTRPIKYAFALDGGAATIVTPIPDATLGSFPNGWTTAVETGVWPSSSTLNVASGNHTLRIWALEPGVVLQRIVVDLGGMKSSYLGPPESFHV